jgi:precorrin-6B methylase 1
MAKAYIVGVGPGSPAWLTERARAAVAARISCTQLAAAVARVNLDESVIVSFHEERNWDRERAFMRDAFRAGRHLVVLTGPASVPKNTAAYLIEQGIDPQTEVLVGESLTLPEQKITRTTLAGVTGQEFHWLSTLVVIHPVGINPLVDRAVGQGKHGIEF